MEEVGVKKQPETAEGKKKRKCKEKRVEGDGATWPKKKKKEKKSSEKRQSRREEKRLKKEEKKKRAVSPDFDGESTTARVKEGKSLQDKESAQPQVSSTYIRMVATEDKEDPDITPLMRCHKENAPQGSTSDLARKLHDKEVRRNMQYRAEEKEEGSKMSNTYFLPRSSLKRDERKEEEEEEEKKKNEEKEKRHKANVQRIRESKRKEVTEWKRKQEEQHKKRNENKNKVPALHLLKKRAKRKLEAVSLRQLGGAHQ
ncbi:protein MNN4-like [Benincasa hispida]|uniref:protein MNN4-like n=1 Tax=Benincasa hispida TaxID=102211 RepID=UPI0019001A82|nr:protein MNN4-like [Benincasa hispida]